MALTPTALVTGPSWRNRSPVNAGCTLTLERQNEPRYQAGHLKNVYCENYH
jgi:hypothetical protein